MILVWLAIISVAIFADQLTKWLAVMFIKGGEAVEVIPWFIQFSYVENRGAAWGMFSDQRWVFLIVSSVAIIGILVYMFLKRPTNKLLVSALLLIVSGGIGNMIDRILLGYVVDFLDFTFINFPVFNVADTFVCIGAGLMMLYLILSTVKEYKNEKRSKSNEKTAVEADSDGRGSSGNET
jgi:signal peptidase II